MEDNKPADGDNPDAHINTPGSVITPEEFAKLKGDFTTVVDELKELRKKNQELAASAEKPAEAPKVDNNDIGTQVASIVHELRKQEKEAEAKNNKTIAFEKFVSENKDFHPDNDPTGLKRKALEEKLSRFNTNGLESISDFYSVVGEASILLQGNDTHVNTSKEINNPYTSTGFPKVAPSGLKVSSLTPKEQKLVDQGFTTEEKLKKLKVSQPSFYNQLMERVND